MTRQITVRGVSSELAKRLKELAAARGESANTTVLRILEEATGINPRRQRLSRYTTWSDGDLAEFEEALRGQRTIDEELWT